MEKSLNKSQEQNDQIFSAKLLEQRQFSSLQLHSCKKSKPTYNGHGPFREYEDKTIRYYMIQDNFFNILGYSHPIILKHALDIYTSEEVCLISAVSIFLNRNIKSISIQTDIQYLEKSPKDNLVINFSPFICSDFLGKKMIQKLKYANSISFEMQPKCYLVINFNQETATTLVHLKNLKIFKDIFMLFTQTNLLTELGQVKKIHQFICSDIGAVLSENVLTSHFQDGNFLCLSFKNAIVTSNFYNDLYKFGIDCRKKNKSLEFYFPITLNKQHQKEIKSIFTKTFKNIGL